MPKETKVPSVVAANGTISRENEIAFKRERLTEAQLIAVLEDPQLFGDLIEKIQQNAIDATLGLRSMPFLPDGVYHKDISFASGVDYRLPHRLNRPYRGWLLCRMRGAAPALIESATQDAPSAFLVLTPSATFTADIWVY